MKRLLLSILSMVMAVFLSAQAPQSFKYQTVVRNSDGSAVLASQTVAFRISILKGSESGTSVYTETFSIPTNDFGLATFNIGEGTPVTGTFSSIDWSTGIYYMKVEIDPDNGTDFEEVGTSQLLSVPFALFSENTVDLKSQVTSLGDKFYSGSLLKDIDGNVYNTVKIGNQAWMAENLRVTQYADGTPINMVTDNAVWNALTLTDRAYTFLDNDPGNAEPWGAYYTWSTVTNGVSSNTNPSNVQGICPDGWHVPSDAEWQELELFIGMSPADTSKTGISRGTNEGGKLKEAGFDHFWSPNEGATNETGFTGLPAGNRTFNSGFDNLHKYANFWTSRRGTGDNAATRVLYYQYPAIGRYINDNDNRTGINCRCVKDEIDETSSGSINIESSANNLTGQGIITDGTIDINNTGFGAALFMASDGNYEEADADNIAAMPCVALALERGIGIKRILLQGFISHDTWTWTPGGLIYVSPDTGALTQTIPSTSGQQVQIVGYATKSNTIFFNPNLMLIEIK
jgi:uncharacterized protein (TIGR02145 family)